MCYVRMFTYRVDMFVFYRYGTCNVCLSRGCVSQIERAICATINNDIQCEWTESDRRSRSSNARSRFAGNGILATRDIEFVRYVKMIRKHVRVVIFFVLHCIRCILILECDRVDVSKLFNVFSIDHTRRRALFPHPNDIRFWCKFSRLYPIIMTHHIHIKYTTPPIDVITTRDCYSLNCLYTNRVECFGATRCQCVFRSHPRGYWQLTRHCRTNSPSAENMMAI